MTLSRLVCRFCEFSTPSVLKHLQHHFNHRHISQRYHCGYKDCKISFQTESSLRSHILRVHKRLSASVQPSRVPLSNTNSQYVCTVQCCQRSFLVYSEFMKHLKSHIRVGITTLCPAEGCGKYFNDVQSFSGHMVKAHRTCKPAAPSNSVGNNNIGNDAENGDGVTPDMYVLGDEDDLPTFEDELSSEKFLESMCQFYMKLEFDYFLSATAVQCLATELSVVQSLNTDLIEKRLRKKLNDSNVDNIDSIVSFVLAENPILKAQQQLKTDYLRKETFKKHFSYVTPIQLPTRNKHFYYVPLLGTIAALFSDKSLDFKLSTPRFSSDPDLLKDYTDGYVFQNNPFFINNPLGLHFIVYQDAFEVAAALGPAKKKHKIVGIYLLVGNIPHHLRSRISSIQLIALCNEKYLDHNSVYGPIVKDLKILETDGVDVPGVGIVKGSLVCIVGDNLGNHGLGGFVEQFSTSMYFCRFCHITREAFHAEGGELISFEQRSKDSYNDALAKLARSKKKIYKGIKFDSIFNSLKYFHVCLPALCECLAHDLFEGLVAYDLKIFIDYFVNKGWFSYESLNSAIAAFQFSAKDKRDCPIPVQKDHVKVKGGAMQICTFLRLFPLIVSEFIDDDNDPVWLAVLSLIEIVEIVLSPVIHRSYLPYLQECINDYLHSRKTLFPDVNLRPKHHYLSHYPELINALGPAIRVFTLRFESKHSFFKRTMRVIRSFKNPTFSLAVRHELYQSYRRSGSDKHYNVNVKGDVDFNPERYSEEIQRAISSCNKLPANVCECVSAEVTGTTYLRGNVVVIGQNTYQSEVEMGRIVLILFDNKEGVFLLLEKLVTNFIPSLRMYEIGQKLSYVLIFVSDLFSSQSLHVYKSGSHQYVKLRFGLVCDALV